MPEPGWRPWASVFKEAQLARCLFLDDLGSVRGARDASKQGWWKERLAGLLRKREAECSPTIITSNAETIDEMKTINHSLPSRFASTRLVFRLAGDDYRLRREDG